MLGSILFFSIIAGVLSLLGGCTLLFLKKLSTHAMLILISFAAGVLLAVSFLDLLPEAVELGSQSSISADSLFLWMLGGIISFFLFERTFVWFHHHHDLHEDQPPPIIPMVLIGDTLHNFIDGIVITASFMSGYHIGVTTAIAVGAHELPQEIADFSLFLSKGVRKRTVFLFNLISSLSTMFGAIIAYYFLPLMEGIQPFILAFTSGMFTYIAGSDLIPELHHTFHKKSIMHQIGSFFIGLLVVFIMRTILE